MSGASATGDSVLLTLNRLLVADRDVLLVSAVQAEADPVPLIADLFVAAVALTAGTVAVGTEDGDLIAL